MALTSQALSSDQNIVGTIGSIDYRRIEKRRVDGRFDDELAQEFESRPPLRKIVCTVTTSDAYLY